MIIGRLDFKVKALIQISAEQEGQKANMHMNRINSKTYAIIYIKEMYSAGLSTSNGDIMILYKEKTAKEAETVGADIRDTDIRNILMDIC